MSGMFNRYPVQSAPGMGVSLSDLPVIGGVLGYLDNKVKQAVEYIVQKYAEYQKVSIDAPAAVADARRILEVLQSTDATADQLAKARAYLAATEQAERESKKRDSVDRVFAWVRSLTGTKTLGVAPAIPLWLAGTAAVAVITVSTALKSWNEAKTVRLALQSGFTPEQIAKLGVGRSPFGSGLFGATSAVTIGAVAIGAYFLLRAFRGK